MKDCNSSSGESRPTHSSAGNAPGVSSGAPPKIASSPGFQKAGKMNTHGGTGSVGTSDKPGAYK